MMKRPLQTSLLTCGAMLLAVFTASVASGQVQYRLEQIPIPEGFFTVNDFNNQNLVVGHSRFIEGETVVLYDHDGILGVPGKTWSLEDLIEVPAEFSITSILDINESGQFVAYLERDDGTRESILVNLFDGDGNLAPKQQSLTVPESNSSSYASRLNDFGLVAGTFVSVVSGERNIFLLDTTVEGAIPLVLTDPITELPVVITAPASLRLNNLGQVSGNAEIGGTYSGFRFTPGFEMLPPVLLLTPLDETVTGAQIRDMNDFGEMTGEARVTVTGSGRKPKTTSSYRGIRFGGTDYLGYDRLPLTAEVYCWDINNAGDILGSDRNNSFSSPFVMHGSNPIYLDDVVTGEADDLSFWRSVTGHSIQRKMTDPDDTGFGRILMSGYVATTTGKGKQQTTTYDTRSFILTPELP